MQTEPIDPLLMSDVADALFSVVLGQNDFSGLHDRIMGNTRAAKTRNQIIDLDRVRNGMQVAEQALIQVTRLEQQLKK